MKGDAASAVAPFQKAVALEPGNTAYATALGAALVGAQQFAPAIDVLTRLTAQPDYKQADGFVALGQAYVQGKRYKDALPVLEKATSLAPDNADAWATLGWAYFGLKDAAKFKETAGKARTLGYKEPHAARSYLKRSRAARRSSSETRGEAERGDGRARGRAAGARAGRDPARCGRSSAGGCCSSPRPSPAPGARAPPRRSRACFPPATRRSGDGSGRSACCSRSAPRSSAARSRSRSARERYRRRITARRTTATHGGGRSSQLARNEADGLFLAFLFWGVLCTPQTPVNGAARVCAVVAVWTHAYGAARRLSRPAAQRIGAGRPSEAPGSRAAVLPPRRAPVAGIPGGLARSAVSPAYWTGMTQSRLRVLPLLYSLPASTPSPTWQVDPSAPPIALPEAVERGTTASATASLRRPAPRRGHRRSLQRLHVPAVLHAGRSARRSVGLRRQRGLLSSPSPPISTRPAPMDPSEWAPPGLPSIARGSIRPVRAAGHGLMVQPVFRIAARSARARRQGHEHRVVALADDTPTA